MQIKLIKFVLPTQLSQRLQCDARGGRNILHVKQYFNFTVCPRTRISLVLGGGLNVGELALFGTSETHNLSYCCE